MSWEEGFAWRAARFYGPDLCRAGREQRIGASRERIALLEARTREERAAHKAGCDRCFCMTAMAYTPEQSGRSDRVQFMRQLIASEEQDEAYARAARSHPVQYRNHVDGFCRYWQNLRHRKFEAAGLTCEECRELRPLQEGQESGGALIRQHPSNVAVGTASAISLSCCRDLQARRESLGPHEGYTSGMSPIHVALDKSDGGWAVKPEGQDQPVSTHPTQAEAAQAAKSRAREHGDPEVVIHRADGRICDRDTIDS